MRPQHRPKSLHNNLHLLQPQFPLPTPTLANILLELIQPFVDLLMLRQQRELFLESGHFARQHGEDVLLFDAVVHGQVVAEVGAGGEEGADGHAAWPFAGFAGAVEEVPGAAEVFVLKSFMLAFYCDGWGVRGGTYEVVHVVGHAVVYPEVLRAQLG